jgi:hypothetical protein
MKALAFSPGIVVVACLFREAEKPACRQAGRRWKIVAICFA